MAQSKSARVVIYESVCATMRFENDKMRESVCVCEEEGPRCL